MLASSEQVALALNGVYMLAPVGNLLQASVGCMC